MIHYAPSSTLITGEDPIELFEAGKDRVVTMHASDRYLDRGTLEDLRRMKKARPVMPISSSTGSLVRA